MSLEGSRAEFVENKTLFLRLNIAHIEYSYTDTRNVVLIQRKFIKMLQNLRLTAVDMKITVL
jgi:hypothetical protein